VPPEISIIVPVYNTCDYLRRCVDSILSQTFSSFEVILVDDGSTDSSATICDEYAQKNGRVRVVHTQNGGQASARNLGVKIAAGKYISFVDSDDSIEPEMYQLMHDKAEASNLDLVICDLICINEEGIAKSSVAIVEDEIIHIKSYGVMNYIFENILSSKHELSSCNKLFCRQIIHNNNIWFPQTKEAIYEDAFFFMKYIFFTNRIGFVDKPLYNYYRDRQGSSSRQKRLDRLEYYIAMVKELQDYLVSKNMYIEYKELFPCLCLYFFGLGSHQLKNNGISEVQLQKIASGLNNDKYFTDNMRWIALSTSSARYLVRHLGYSKIGAFTLRYYALLSGIGKTEKMVKSVVKY